MNRSVLSYFPFLITIVFFAYGCANISSPTGGPKDVNPPAIKKEVPVNGSANFKGEGFEIEFDEYIVLDKVMEKFMVSPPLNKNPVITAKGKNLVVEFKEKLRDSTTYTFYFQDAIKDLNEGNAINNYQFVFSTGPVVDSLSVTGNIYNATDLEAGPDFLVLLHKGLADSSPRIKIPTYITKTDKTGAFRINNVKEGDYKIYALLDKNNNKLYDQDIESFAFLDSVLKIDATHNYFPAVKDSVRPKTVAALKVTPAPVIGEYSLYSFIAPKKTQYITSSARSKSYSLLYTFALPLDTAKFDFFIPGATPQSYFIEENSSRDTFKIWITDSTLYSKEVLESIIKHPYTDTTGMLVNITDTIPMRFLLPRQVRGAKKQEKLSYTLNFQAGTLKPDEKILLKSLTPFIEPDTSRIKLFETKDTILIKMPYTMVKDKANSCKYIIDAKFKENSKYFLMIDSAALGDMYGTVSDSTGIKFSVRIKDSFASLTLNISGYDKELIIELLDNNEKLISQIRRKGPGKVVFPFLEKGIYRARAIYDLDGNGKWTTGDYDFLRQPEPVSYYPNELDLKVNNWDLVQDWKLNTKNFKNQALRKKPAGS
jgi:hypothetical protein